MFGGDDRTPLLTLGHTDLDGRVSHPGAEEGARYGRVLAGGKRGVVYVWVTLPRTAATAESFRHKLTFVAEDGSETYVDGPRFVLSSDSPVVLGPPLQGIWLAHNGPGNKRCRKWEPAMALQESIWC